MDHSSNHARRKASESPIRIDRPTLEIIQNVYTYFKKLQRGEASVPWNCSEREIKETVCEATGILPEVLIACINYKSGRETQEQVIEEQKIIQEVTDDVIYDPEDDDVIYDPLIEEVGAEDEEVEYYQNDPKQNIAYYVVDIQDKKSKRISKPNISTFDICMLRHYIYNTQLIDKRACTLEYISKRVQEELGYPEEECNVDAIKRIMLRLGYVWKSCRENRKLCVERDDIRTKRKEYLRLLSEARQTNRSIVYINEVQNRFGFAARYHWYQGQTNGLLSPYEGGPLFTDANFKDRVLPSALLIFKTEEERNNIEQFSKYFNGKILPKIPPKSIVVVDGASFPEYSRDMRLPTVNSKKYEILSYLKEHNIQHNEHRSRIELLEIAHRHDKNKARFNIEKLLEAANHTVLR